MEYSGTPFFMPILSIIDDGFYKRFKIIVSFALYTKHIRSIYCCLDGTVAGIFHRPALPRPRCRPTTSKKQEKEMLRPAHQREEHPRLVQEAVREATTTIQQPQRKNKEFKL